MGMTVKFLLSFAALAMCPAGVRAGGVADGAAAYSLDDPAANHVEEGIARDARGDKDGSIACFRAATRHAPESDAAYLNLGVACMREKRLREAQDAYGKAQAINPANEFLKDNMKALENWVRHYGIDYDPEQAKKKKKKKKKQTATTSTGQRPPVSNGACTKHKDCTKKDFCGGAGECYRCKHCEEPADSKSGKCPCGPGKRKNKSKSKKGAPRSEAGGGGGQKTKTSVGPGGTPLCAAHGDCGTGKFCCWENECLPCVECAHDRDAADGKCPCGPGKKKGKKEKAQGETTPGDDIDDDDVLDEL